MFRNKEGRLALCLAMALGAVLVSRPARAANITLQGTIATDDAVQLFNLTVATAGSVDIRSYGYAGGTTSTGTVVPRGGFDTILTLFNASGAFIDDNDEGAGVATDPATGLAADARLTENLTSGNYIVALTQYDNFSIGNLAAGFAEQGHSNFTADPSFAGGGPCPGNMFRDISGTAGRCRNGNWTVDFVNVASVSAVASTPEPSALLLAGAGLALLLLGRFSRRKVALLTGGLVVALTSVPVKAQTDCPSATSGPDYCNVSDFLNGQRTLLQVTDLQIINLVPGVGPQFTQVKTSNSNQTPQTPFIPPNLGGVDSSTVPATFSAHMFNQPSATTITTLDNNGTFALWLQNVASLATGNGIWYPTVTGDNPLLMSGAVADFNQDGYDDLALSFNDYNGVYTLWVMTPNNINDASQGVRRGLTYVNANPLSAIAAGDFAGDGEHEIAGLTILPSGGLKLVIYTINPSTLVGTVASSLTLTTPGASSSTPITVLSMTTGRFTSLTHDQLAVAYATASNQTRVEFIDFPDGNLNAQEIAHHTPTLPNVTTPGGYIQVKAGKFGLPTNPYDQIVYHNSSTETGAISRFFAILSVSVDSTGTTTFQQYAPVIYDTYPCAAANGVQVGNFDNRQPDPLNPGQTEHNPNSQIAFLFCNGTTDSSGHEQFDLNIYSVDPSSFSVTLISATSAIISPSEFPSFVPTDLQGRSLILGEPTKITIDSNISPIVVIGAPPMHVDYLVPPNETNATVLNVSVVPDTFHTSYNTSSSTGNSGSTTNKTSWSFGAKESVNGSLTIGNPNVEGVKLSDTLTAAQNLKGQSTNTNGTFSSEQISSMFSTGFGDDVIFVDSQFNIWSYPVIGQTVCPAATPNCPPGQQGPLTIQFSAPNGNAATTISKGAMLSWYQPPWEPGNIFSYPAPSQLADIKPKLTTLATGTAFATNGGTSQQTTSWTNNTTTSQTVGFDQDYSFDNNFSAQGSFSFAGIGAGGGYSLDLSGSYGLSTLSQTTTALDSSTGLTINVPGTFATPSSFAYIVAPVITGSTPGQNVVDSQPNTSDLQTYGRLRGIFTADPLDTTAGAGGWWGSNDNVYGNYPDVALNHPARWTSVQSGIPSSGNPIPANCLPLGTGNLMDCASVATPDPSDPADDPFHWLRGFFISSANFPDQGPQLEYVNAGDWVNLSVRVYNYSFTPMPPNTIVHVAFYYMPWNTTTQKPADSQGTSYLINDNVVTASPIPAWSDAPGAPLNWTIVGTPFNTGTVVRPTDSDVSVVFWVVVWMEDVGMVTEVPYHGLTGVPPTFGSWTEAVNFECPNLNSCYSNNVGLFKQPLYIASAGQSASNGQSASAVQSSFAAAKLYSANSSRFGGGPGAGTPSVDIGKLELSDSRVTLRDKVRVSATVSAEGADARTMSVNFYDGDPKEGGRLYEMVRIPHIPEGGRYKVVASYRPITCGRHELFAVMNQGKPNEVVRRAPTLRVACNAWE